MMRLLRMDAGARERVCVLLGRELEREAAVAFAYLHGSFLGGPAFRDVDVAVHSVGDDPAAFPQVALAERLSAAAALPVDVRLLNGAPDGFVYHALRGRLLLCRDEDVLAEVIEGTVRRYLDAAPLLRRATREAFAA